MSNKIGITLWQRPADIVIKMQIGGRKAIYFNCRNEIGKPKFNPSKIMGIKVLRMQTKESIVKNLTKIHKGITNESHFGFSCGFYKGGSAVPDQYAILTIKDGKADIKFWVDRRKTTLKVPVHFSTDSAKPIGFKAVTPR